MLKLILGRAKSGKTRRIMEEIATFARDGEEGMLFIVPEQYSHEAERELLRVCGDSLSLHAEVMSFSRLALRVASESGGAGRTFMDAGGRALAMALAVEAVGSRLKVYSAARRQTQLQESLLAAIDELKSACISPEQLLNCPACHSADGLGDKLRDLSLVYAAYDALASQAALDPMDRLSWLAADFMGSRWAGKRIYIDGFTDFTAQQRLVIEKMLRSGCELTVCLGCPGLWESHEIFEPSRRAALALDRMAAELGVEVMRILQPRGRDRGVMGTVEQELFAFGSDTYDTKGCVILREARSLAEECEAAAERCLELLRGGARMRDIAIAVRGYESYRPALENIFQRYGLPLFSARKSDIFEKPIPALIRSAFAVISGGWSYEDVFTYLKTGLGGLDMQECDELENYVFLWSLRGRAWTKTEDWSLHPEGFDAKFDDESRERLRRINALRRRAAAPLALLEKLGGEAKSAAEHCGALAEFFKALGLASRLQKRAKELRALGMDALAAEYSQLWEIIVSALEQCAAVLGDMELEQEAFGRLFCLVLSKYDVGSIPLSLDKISAGDMDRMRRRNIKHLLVLGCDSSRVPSVDAGHGLFSDDDRETLRAAGMEIGEGPADRLYREFALVYNCLSLPSESLCISYCSADSEGGTAQPAFPISRLKKVFDLETELVDIDRCRMAAPAPALELAAAGGIQPTALSMAARRYFEEEGRGEDLRRIAEAAALSRGRLSREAVRALYGSKLRLSASRIDKMASCPFSYFLQYGLKAKPRQAAEFSPPEIGTFIHAILENVAKSLRESGGFASADTETVEALCDRFVEEYIHETLDDFRERSPRFEYHFRRLIKSVRAIVSDMVEELRRGKFEPLDFELDFGKASEFPPVELGEGDSSLTLTGIADRVDGYYHEGKLYVRVVDYKTGRKEFSLSDVCYGMGLQMLLYLFALERSGSERYEGAEIVPAGVLYVPARDKLLPLDSDSDADIEKARREARRRKGMILDNESIIRAMEDSDEPRYIPMKMVRGRLSRENLVSAERMGILARHVDETLKGMARELHSGCIAADPYFRSQTESACRYCDYERACRFDSAGDNIRYLKKLDNDEVWARMEGGGDK